MRPTWTAAAAVSVLAAVLECAAAERPWSWADFTQAGLRNLLLAAAVLVVAAHAPTRPDPATSGPALPIQLDFSPGTAPIVGGHVDAQGRPAHLAPNDWADLVRREVGELTTLADHLYGMTDLAGHEAELTEDTFVRLDDLRWLLGNYVLTGGRIRGLAQLPDLAAATEDCHQPADSFDTVRDCATDLLQRITDTNTVAVDWLLAHRVALPDADYLDSNAMLGRYHRLELEPTSISGDPLYLLTCHIHDVLETVECVGNVDHPILAVLETQLARVLTTIENEITSAQAFNAALISLARDMRSADAA